MTPSRGRLAGTAMLLLAPTIIVGAYLFHFISSDSPGFVQDIADQHTRFVVGGLVMSIGGFLFAPTAVGLIRLAGARGRTVVTVGALLAAVGGVALGAGDLMMTLVLGSLTPAHADAARTVQDVAGSSALATLPFQLAPALVLGLVIAGIGLFLGGLRPRWLPVCLAVGAVAIMFAPDGIGSPLLHAPLALSVGALGAVLLRQPAEGPVRRTPAAVPETV